MFSPLEQAARQKEEEERAELEAYSFRPTISKLARQIKASEAVLGGPGAAYQRLYQRASDCTVKRQVGGAAGRSATTAVSGGCAGTRGALGGKGQDAVWRCCMLHGCVVVCMWPAFLLAAPLLAFNVLAPPGQVACCC